MDSRCGVTRMSGAALLAPLQDRQRLAMIQAVCIRGPLSTIPEPKREFDRGQVVAA